MKNKWKINKKNVMKVMKVNNDNNNLKNNDDVKYMIWHDMI